MNLMRAKLLFLILLTFMIACSSNDTGSVSPDHEKILSSAAFQGITDSIEQSPENVELLLSRAVRLSQQNFHKTATADYKKAYELTGDENIALEYTSNLLLASDVNTAIDMLEEGSKKFPENTEFSRRLAEIYTQNRAYNKALDEYEKIVAIDPSNFEAWFERGTLLALMNDTSQAITSLENSFAIMPINYTGLALANLYISRKDPRALEICDILLSRDTTGIQTEPLYMKGVFYSETDQPALALKQFEECIKRDWKMTDAYIEKGIIHFERKEYNKALEVFNMAATVSNTDADAYFWMGRCFEATGKKEEAILNYERAIALDNNFSEAKDALRRLNS